MVSDLRYSLSSLQSLDIIYRRHWRASLALSLIFSLGFAATEMIRYLYFQDKIWSDPLGIVIGVFIGVIILLIQLLLLANLQIIITDLISNSAPLPRISDRLSLALRRYLWPVVATLLLNLLCLVVSMLLSIALIIVFPVVLVFASATLTIGFIVCLGQLSPVATIKKVITIGIKHWRSALTFSLMLVLALLPQVLVPSSIRYDDHALSSLVVTWLASFVYGLIAPWLAWRVALELNAEAGSSSELQPAVNPVG